MSIEEEASEQRHEPTLTSRTLHGYGGEVGYFSLSQNLLNFNPASCSTALRHVSGKALGLPSLHYLLPIGLLKGVLWYPQNLIIMHKFE